MSKTVLGVVVSVVTALLISLIMWFMGVFNQGQTAIDEAKIRQIAKDEIVAAGVANTAAVDANSESIKDLEGNFNKLDNKIERIVDILLED